MPEKILFVSIDDASEDSKKLLRRFIQSTVPQNAIINILNETEEEMIDGESLGDIIDITYLVDYDMKDKVLDELNSNEKYRGKLNAYEADVNVDATDPNDQIISTRSLYGINVDASGGSIIDFDKTKVREQEQEQEDEHEYADDGYEKVDLDDLLSGIYSETNKEADLPNINQQNQQIDISSDLASINDIIDDLLPSPEMISKELNPRMDDVNPTDMVGILLKNQYQNMLLTSYTIMSDNIAKVSTEQLNKDILEFKKSLDYQNIPEVNDYIDARRSLLEYEEKVVEKANEIQNAYENAMNAWIESQKPALIAQFKSENEDTTPQQLAAFMETVKADKEIFNQEIAKIKEDATSELLIRFIQQCKSDKSKDAMKFLTLKKQAEEEARSAIGMLSSQGNQLQNNQLQQPIHEEFNETIEQPEEELALSYSVTANQIVPENEQEATNHVPDEFELDEDDNEALDNLLNEYNIGKMQDDGFSDSSDSLDDEDFISEEELAAELEKILSSEEGEDDEQQVEINTEEINEEPDGEVESSEESFSYTIPEFNEDELLNNSEDDNDYDNSYDDEYEDEGYYDDDDEEEDDDDDDDDEEEDDDDDEYYEDEDSDKKSKWKQYALIALACIGIGGLSYGSYTLINESKAPSQQKTEQTSKQSDSKTDLSESGEENNQSKEADSKDEKSNESASEGTSEYAKVGDKITVTDDKQIFNVTITSINKDGSATAKDSDGKTWQLSEAILKKWAEKNKNQDGNDSTQESQQD